MYRFGDSTPFPLRENFIETLAAVVDAAVALYRADSVADEAHRKAREVRKAAADELRRLDALSTLMASTIAPLAPTAPTGRDSDAATVRILELGREVIGRARDTVVAKRDEAMQQAVTSRHHAMCRAALGALFAEHGLPHAEWAVEWSAVGDEARLLVSQQATKALAVELRGAPAADDRFGKPLRISELCPTLTSITLGDGADRKRSDKLGQLAVLELDLSPHGTRVAIGRADKRGGGIVVVRRHGAPVAASYLTAEGSIGGRVVLDAAGELALGELCDAVEACRGELVARRRELAAASLHGQSIDELEQPATLAEELLAAVAPLVREMRLRSRVPGELVLKRDLGGDRREELFVPRAALAARYAELPDTQRRAFDAIGLGDEATMDFRARIARGTEPAVRPAMPLPARTVTPAVIVEDATPTDSIAAPRRRSTGPGRTYAPGS